MPINQPNPYAAPRTVDLELCDDSMRLFEGRLKTAAIGLKVMNIGILLLMVQVIAWFVVPVMGVAGLSAMFGILLLITLGCIAIGPLLCIGIPQETELRTLALIPATIELAGIGLGMFYLYGRSFVLFLMAATTIALAAALFLLFLYRLALVIKRFDLAKKARAVFFFEAIMFTSFLGGMVLSNLSLSVLLMAILVIAALVSGMLFMAGYANLVKGLSDAILNPVPQDA